MLRDSFLYCRRCSEVHHVTPFDQAPLYDYGADGVREIPADDRRAFLERHSGHGIEELMAVAEPKIRNGRANDPLRIWSVEVSNGDQVLVLRASRKSFAEPLRYRVVPKQLKLWE